MSDTPRTDAKWTCAQMCSQSALPEIMRDFARSLEQELCEMHKLSQQQYSRLIALKNELDAMTAARDKVTEKLGILKTKYNALMTEQAATISILTGVQAANELLSSAVQRALTVSAGNDDFNHCLNCAEVNEILAHAEGDEEYAKRVKGARAEAGIGN